MQVSILIDSQTEEKIEGRTLTIKFLDKKGIVQFTKEVKMPEIEADYGNVSIDFELESKDLLIIYDIQIEAMN